MTGVIWAVSAVASVCDLFVVASLQRDRLPCLRSPCKVYASLFSCGHACPSFLLIVEHGLCRVFVVNAALCLWWPQFGACRVPPCHDVAHLACVCFSLLLSFLPEPIVFKHISHVRTPGTRAPCHPIFVAIQFPGSCWAICFCAFTCVLFVSQHCHPSEHFLVLMRPC